METEDFLVSASTECCFQALEGTKLLHCFTI